MARQGNALLKTRQLVFIAVLAGIAFLAGLGYAATRSVSVASQMDLNEARRVSDVYSYATIFTTKGEIEVELLHDIAPHALAYFIAQVGKGVYEDAPLVAEDGVVATDQHRMLQAMTEAFENDRIAIGGAVQIGDLVYANSRDHVGNFAIVASNSPSVSAGYLVVAHVVRGMGVVRSLAVDPDDVTIRQIVLY